MTTSAQKTGTRTWTDLFWSGLEYMKENAQYYYDAAQTPGAETPKRVAAAARGCVQIGAVVTVPVVAVVGVCAGSGQPKLVKRYTDKMDSLLTRFWNSLSLNQKVGAVGAGVPAAIAGVKYLFIPATAFSAKVGAELALRNYKQEQIAEVTKAMEDDSSGAMPMMPQPTAPDFADIPLTEHVSNLWIYAQDTWDHYREKSCRERVWAPWEYVKKRAKFYYDAAYTQGAETPKRVLACARGCLEVGSIAVAPWYALGGNLIAASRPDFFKGATELVDGVIVGIWNKASLTQKVVVVGVTVPVAVAGYSYLIVPFSLFSVKVGAELAIRNYKKEQDAEKARQEEAAKAAEEEIQKLRDADAAQLTQFQDAAQPDPEKKD